MGSWMKDLYSRLCPKTLRPSSNATSSPAAAAGPSPSASPMSRQPQSSGPEAAHVSHSVPPASIKVPQTSGTFGPSSEDSSQPADPSLSLASKFLSRVAGLGHPAFTMTSKTSAIGRNGSMLRLVVSERRTRASDSISWPTPRASDGMVHPLRQPAMVRIGLTSRSRQTPDRLEDALALLYGPGGYANPQWIAWLMGYPTTWLTP